MKRTKEIKVRMSREEFDRLNALVYVTGLSREEYVRRLFAGATVKRNPPADYPGLLRELRRIGAKVDDTLVKVRTLGFVDMLQAKEIYQEVKNLEKVFETTLNCQKGKNETEKIVESDPCGFGKQTCRDSFSQKEDPN